MSHRPRLLLFLLISVFVSLRFFIPPSQSQGTNHSILLNGTSAYVDVPYNANLNITGALTLEAWVKTSSTSYQHVLERGDWFQNQMSYDLTLAEGKARLDIMQSNGSYAAVVGNTTMSLNTWHHIAGVYDGSQMRVYLDGVLDGTATATMAPGNNSTGFRIGTSSFLYFPNYFNGRIDEVRVSNAAIYSSNFTPSVHLSATSSTKGLWKFDGQTANDWSSSSANGTLQGSATYSTDVPTGPNSSPTISITDPLNNTNFTAGANVVIDASATDSDGAISQVEFFQGSTLLGSDSTPPYTFVWNNVAAGSYAINARATDDLGATTTSTPITITVTQAGGYRSVLFNGTSSFVDVPYNANLNITGALTLEAWVKTSSTSYQHVLERGDWFQNQMSYDLTLAEGKVRLDIMQSNGSYAAVVGNTTMSLNAWHHIAGVYDGSQMRVYLDGALDGTATATMAPGNNSTGLRIGKSSFLYFPNYFNGRIDEVRVSNAAVYTSNFAPSAHLTATSNTKGLWKFDNETTNDASASGANGSLQGGATYSTDVPVGSGGGSQIPVAVANGPYSSQLAQSVTFNSSGSFDPDGTISSYHWNFGDGTSANTANPSHAYQIAGLFTATLTVTDNSGLSTSATAPVSINGPSEARLDPLNQTGGSGENPLSRNFNWRLPLVGLPGRAGMDLGLTLSYNSLVWTKNGSYISFDDDRGFPGPGFRLGFPVIQPLYYNAEVGKYAFLLISPDGSRTELRQVGTSALYEAADSSHLLLDAGTMTLFSTDGTQFNYVLMGSEYNCTKIKDRNGNYLTINYTPFGRIDTIIDTLARTIKFNYDNGWLTSITQVWNQGTVSQVTHNWATFSYTNTLINTSFSGLTVLGPANNSTIKTLSSVTLADGSHSNFSYTSWGQVWKVSAHAADDHLLNQRAYNLPGSPLLATSAQTDCPRFTERRDWAQYWNGDTEGTPAETEEAVTTFSGPVSGTWTMPDNTQQTGIRVQVTAPDGTANKIYFIGTAATSSGWRRGLPTLVETYSGTDWRRKVMTTWTQDNTSLSYPLNPRVTETNIYDPEGNRARTQITYQQFTFADGTNCYLPRDTFEYAADAATILRSTQTDYHAGTSYSDRRILGLASERRLYEGDVNNSGTLISKVGFFYDNENGASSIQGTDAPVQHDNTNYSASFVTGRANLSSVRRYDVTNIALFTTTRTTYNTSGAVVSSKDALSHEVTISYADSFSDGNNTRNTIAYPTTVTDPDGYSSTAQYHFDFGAVTQGQTPEPNVTTNTPGPVQILEYDAIGRLERRTNQFNGAYVRFEYSTSQIQTDTYATIEDEKGEAHSFAITDGAGRVLANAMDHLDAINHYSGQRFAYDVLGRRIKTSNPTETTAIGNPFQWDTAGDDAAAGWIYSEQTYDWKGRPTVAKNQDGTTRTASYSGCGCAGGEVVTLTDEGTIVAGVTRRRQQKMYSDVLGRTAKSETLNWENGDVYSSTVYTYNARDQIDVITNYAGAEGNTPQQQTSMTYDGYGRLKTRHVPEQQAGLKTVWTYNDDDTIQTVTDARGATCTYSYNGRHMPNTITHALSGSSTIAETFAYDGAGNRKSMSHTVGGVAQDSADYQYDLLSRMRSETKHINALSGNAMGGNYTIGYTYTISDQLRSVTDPFDSPTNFAYDKVGRTLSVTGTFAGVSYEYAKDVTYRAWGDVKTATIFGGSETISYNSRLDPTAFRLGQMRYDYTYFDDGRLKQFTDLDDQIGDPHFVQFHYMSRAYAYDQAGRVSSVGQVGNVIPPFSGTYTYDTFDNMTTRSGQYALGSFRTDSASYTNNRRDGWSYNAEGQISFSSDASDDGGSSTRTWTYDAAGALISNSEIRSGLTTTNELKYDGDGELLAESSNGSVRDYLIRSTVLGTVLTKLTPTGGKDITYVPADDLVLPLQNQNPGFSPFMSAVYRDALGIQEQQTNSQYSFYAYDPMGNVIPNTQPPLVGTPPYVPFYGATYGGASWSSFSLANNLASGCNYRGAPSDCSTAMMRTMGLGFAANLPGAHLDNALAEYRYGNDVSSIFAEAAQRNRQKTPPKLKPGRKVTAQQRKKNEQQRRKDVKRIGNSEEISPQNPAPTPTQDRLPFNTCDEFVNWLSELASSSVILMGVRRSNVNYSARGFGTALAIIAYYGYERHINNGFDGFKGELVNAGEGTPAGRQGAGVYGHILFSSGAGLVAKAGFAEGAAAYQANRLKDWGQALFGSSQYQSERAGNIAGKAVGDQLWTYFGGKMSQSELINNLHGILCE